MMTNIQECAKTWISFLRAKGAPENTIIAYKQALKDFCEFLGDKDFSHPSTAYQFISSNKSLKPSSLNAKVSALSSFYDFLIQTRVVKENIFKSKALHTKQEKTFPKPLNNKEINAFFNFLPVEYIPLFRLMLYAGLRVSEVCNVKIDNIKQEGRVRWILTKGKGNKERFTPILTNKVINLNGKKYSPSQLKALAWRISKKINLSITCHMFRHTFATYVINKGVPLVQLQAWLGHTDPKTTLIYAKLSHQTAKLWAERIF